MKIKKLISFILVIIAIAILFIIGADADQYSASASIEALGKALGFYSLIPTLLAASLAFLLGDVVIALLVGLVYGQLMINIVSGIGPMGVLSKVVPTTVAEIIDTASTRGNTQVLVLCALVGGMVGVLRLTGGFKAAADRLCTKINTPRRANIVSQLFCMVFFFDDYANALVSGPVLSPITDKAHVSRERLSYIVDSTAAPVAGIAIVSSWVAVEISVISEGLQVAGINDNAFSLFLKCIPFCFYCLFAIVFILETSLMGREYGPMLEAEKRARGGITQKEGTDVQSESNGSPEMDKKGLRILIAFFCIVFLILYAVTNLILGDGDTIELLLQATFLCGVLSIALGGLTKLFSLSEGVEAYLKGASSLMPTIIVLILAWSLASTVEKLGTVYYVVEIIATAVPWQFVPVLIFVSCCVVSFAAGSYGCMFMVMPMAIPIAVSVMSIPGLDLGQDFLLICIASVISGGIFGDHCSPMTDCTILAALGSGCKTMDHVVTQMPYALTVAALTVICILLSTIGLNVYIALAVGFIAMATIIRLIGKKP